MRLYPTSPGVRRSFASIFTSWVYPVRDVYRRSLKESLGSADKWFGVKPGPPDRAAMLDLEGFILWFWVRSLFPKGVFKKGPFNQGPHAWSRIQNPVWLGR